MHKLGIVSSDFSAVKQGRVRHRRMIAAGISNGFIEECMPVKMKENFPG
jgi:hypothetical protein